MIGKFALAIAMLALPGMAFAAEMRFWNTTSVTIVNLSLAPAGSDQWGANQCENDKDKSVDSDERLKLTGIEPGKYDVRLTDQSGRRCTVKNVEVTGTGHYAFSLADSDLTDCQK